MRSLSRIGLFVGTLLLFLFIFKTDIYAVDTWWRFYYGDYAAYESGEPVVAVNPYNPDDNVCTIPNNTTVDLQACNDDLGAPVTTCCTSSGGCGGTSCGNISQWDWCHAAGCTARPLFGGDCNFSFQYTYNQCPSTDTCDYVGPRDGYLYPGLCSANGCAVSSTKYKICCNTDGTVSSTCNGGMYSGGCVPGTIQRFCGFGGYASCNVSACADLAPAPTETPVPIPTAGPSCACTYNQDCPPGVGSGTQSCSGIWSGSTCVYDSSGSCTPNCTICNPKVVPTATPIPPTSTPGILPAPTGLVGLCPSPGNLASLSWNNVTNATGYSVRTSNSSGQILPSPYSKDGLTANSYSFTSTSGSSYSFVVYAEKSGTWSVASASKNFTCVAPTPVPVTIRITDARCTLSGSNASSSVYWTGTGPIDHYYYTYRAQPDAWLSQILTSSTNLTFASTAGKTYDIQVSACNAANACVQTTSTFSCPVLGQAPTPSITKPACLNAPLPASSSQITISWVNNATPVTFVDISNDNFVTYFKKTVPAGSSSITAPVGFDGLFLDSNGSRINTQTLPIALNQNYYVRTFTNASAPNYGHSTVVSFLIPPCPTTPPGVTIAPTATPTPSLSGAPIPTVAGAPPAPLDPRGDCDSPPGTSATLYWGIVPGATSYQVTVNGNNSTCTQATGAGIITCSNQPTIIGTNSLSVKACNSSGCSPAAIPIPPNLATFTCSNEIHPWIFVDGDVHSNTGIYMH